MRLRLLGGTVLGLVALLALCDVVRAEEDEGPVLRFRVELGDSFATEVTGRRVDTELVIDAVIESRWTGVQEGSVTLDYGELLSPRSPSPSRRPRRAHVPDIMDGVRFVEADRGVLIAWSGPVHYSLSYEERRGLVDPGWGSLAAPTALMDDVNWCWSEMGSFFSQEGIGLHLDRGPNYNVNIFAAWSETLAEPERTRRLFGEMGRRWEPGSLLWGYYDSTSEVANDSAVIVTPVPGRDPRRVICHELAHYAWDRFLVGALWDGETEEFAQKFESRVH